MGANVWVRHSSQVWSGGRPYPVVSSCSSCRSRWLKLCKACRLPVAFEPARVRGITGLPIRLALARAARYAYTSLARFSR